ncbi:MAG TPA: bifunctional pyr operon transcriptional regulator/uracil phosphoribosyltransferase PyrR [Cyanobacteria bacterium UBA8156]|jgi:pyrimidine operon attenuation protein/uracil phosphoribosyltransferase|nr:bifunctional pyr operon transcriptional regulator/uracil phosphoribosyltransferase PyrR [Cyanobacteria bacterium UBA8156]
MLTVEILTAEELRRTVNRLASQVVEGCTALGNLALLGIRTRGVPLAFLLQRQIEVLEGYTVPVGALDITLYRDDLDRIGPRVPDRTEIAFDLTGRQVALIDDVIYSGRTVKAALNAIDNYGRPQSVVLVTLVDRGHRELPIHPDFVGKSLPTAKGEQVRVLLRDVDGRDGVELLKPVPMR